MRMLTLLLLITTFIVSCGEKNNQSGENEVTENPEETEEYPVYNWDTLRGIYSGKFSDKEININLTYVSEFNAVGYSVMSGLIRNISGKVTHTEDSVQITLAEPGDHVHDGTFYLSVHKQNLRLNGTWVAFNSSIPSKTFSLKKKKAISFDGVDYNEPVTGENFSVFYNHCRDSLGEYYFSEDGSVIYDFYNTPDEYESESGAMQRAKGSWSYKANVITVFWQPNFAYPHLKSQFKIVEDKSDDYRYLQLVGEGRVIYSTYGMDY